MAFFTSTTRIGFSGVRRVRSPGARKYFQIFNPYSGVHFEYGSLSTIHIAPMNVQQLRLASTSHAHTLQRKIDFIGSF